MEVSPTNGNALTKRPPQKAEFFAPEGPEYVLPCHAHRINRIHFLQYARCKSRRSQLHVITPQLHPSMSDLKTLFLIRHAESLENERIGCLQRSISNVGRLSLPRLSDLRRSVELINVPAQVDSDVSAVGWDQVSWRGNFIR